TDLLIMSQALGNTGLAYARVWHLVDARQRILGRMAVNIATTLMGKHKPIYDPASDCGDYVVVINAREVVVTGKKEDQKLYRHHTGYPGGLKTINYKRLMEKDPAEIIRKAVSGMLPKNRLREVRLERLKIFPDENHPYDANIIKIYGQTFPNELPEPYKKPKKMSQKKRKELKEKIKGENVENGQKIGDVNSIIVSEIEKVKTKGNSNENHKKN
ncbi:15175_t:CDS:2, partial [Acaulospora colombiana]